MPMLQRLYCLITDQLRQLWPFFMWPNIMWLGMSFAQLCWVSWEHCTGEALVDVQSWFLEVSPYFPLYSGLLGRSARAKAARETGAASPYTWIRLTGLPSSNSPQSLDAGLLWACLHIWIWLFPEVSYSGHHVLPSNEWGALLPLNCPRTLIFKTFWQ